LEFGFNVAKQRWINAPQLILSAMWKSRLELMSYKGRALILPFTIEAIRRYLCHPVPDDEVRMGTRVEYGLTWFNNILSQGRLAVRSRGRDSTTPAAPRPSSTALSSSTPDRAVVLLEKIHKSIEPIFDRLGRIESLGRQMLQMSVSPARYAQAMREVSADEDLFRGIRKTWDSMLDAPSIPSVPDEGSSSKTKEDGTDVWDDEEYVREAVASVEKEEARVRRRN